jgi:hypothetical protein
MMVVGGEEMANPLLSTLAEIARREGKIAVREGDYPRAILSAIVESWASQAAVAAP